MGDELLVTGCGILTAVGQGKADTVAALLRADPAFGALQRPGREGQPAFLGAEINDIRLPERFPPRLLRTVGLSGRAALAVVHEAWEDANLSQADPERIGLIVGGSNVQQRELTQRQTEYAGRPSFLPPSYAVTYLDSDLSALCSAQFGIRGMAYTVGGASASGQLAIIEAARAVSCGEVDVCIAVGALADLSFWELQALRSTGAMGSDRFADDPAAACRPFDRDSDGFVYGEGCAAIVVERGGTATARGAGAYAGLAGWAMTMDANRNPDPSLAGEVRAIEMALERAKLRPAQIDYVNPHGTGSNIGDATELDALRASGLGGAALNTTKSITGHGLSAAGAVEVVATLLQMKASTLHPSRNLDRPIDPGMNWVGGRAVTHTVDHALTLAMGFGGINTALCLSRREGR